MAQTLSITNGKTFKSFSDLSEAIKALEQETFIVYTCLSSNYIKISDKVVDAAARAKLETKKNKLVIRSAKYACIHYGDPVDGRSTGQRPNQKSYKLGCGAYFKVGTRNEMLYIYDCHVTTDVHEKVHKPCPADFAQYPKQRRLNNTEKERLQQLDDLGVNPTKIREVIMKETGKAVPPKDLDNEK